ncbi:hypothetical protein [Acidithiobacillus sp.]
MQKMESDFRNKSYIPPRALRKDTPGGTVWVPRWKWAGWLFGKAVQLPPAPGPAMEHSPAAITEALELGSASRSSPEQGSPSRDPRAQPAPRKSGAGEAERGVPEPWRAWAYPLFGVLSALVIAFALGTSYGYLLAVGRPPSWLSSGAVGALLMAPSGALLLLLSGLACLVQARDDLGTRRIWQITGFLLLMLFLLVTFGGLL